jgi:hypothetical protein
MPSITLDIRDDITPANRRLIGGLRSVNPVIGTAVKKLFQDRFLALGSNKRGFPTTNFWPRAAKATNYQVLPDGVLITVSQQGVRQRLFGGEIHAVNKKYLAIPATAEAYGKSPREFSNLQFFRTKRGGGLKARREVAQLVGQIGGGKNKGKTKNIGSVLGEVVLFWLVKSVHQEPDPDVIPSEVQIRDTITVIVQDVVDRAMRKGGAA